MSEYSQPSHRATELHFVSAKLWHLRRKWERATAGYREVIRLEPSFVPAHLELGWLLQQQGRIEEAIDAYRYGIELNPDSTSLPKGLEALEAKRAASNPNAASGVAVVREFRAAAAGQQHVLIYMDTPDMNGAGQCSHLLMCALRRAGYHVTCVQSWASHQLIEERSEMGIQHLWLGDDDVYDKTQTPRALTDKAEADRIFTTARADLVIFVNGCPTSNLAAEQAALRRGLPYVVIVHCVIEEWAQSFASHLHKLPAVYSGARQVVAVSRANLALLHQLFGLPREHGRVIHPGRPAQYFAPPSGATRTRIRAELNIPDEAVVAFTAARMEEAKGYQYQLRAMAKLEGSDVWPDLFFVWAGSGTLEPRLRLVAEHQGLADKVRFLGDRSDVAELLDSSDLFVLPSQFEGMPGSIMEAMAKGLPVLATSVSGTPEALGDTGMLLPDPLEDSGATVDAIARTIESWAKSVELRRSVGRACKRRADRMFRSDRMVGDQLTVIRDALGGR